MPAAAAEVQGPQAQHPTTTVLRASIQTTAARPKVTLIAAVRSPVPPRLVPVGEIRFSIVSPNPQRLGRAHLDTLGQAELTTPKLREGATYQVLAQFIPAQPGYGRSSDQLSVSLGPAAAASFRITAGHYFGAPGTPLTFTVTAINRQKQPVTDYTGTIDLASPTDRSAKVAQKVYTFTTADHGSHTFVDGITYNKGGAETLTVHQANNTQIQGKATFGIE
jgi:hypothetical protein